MLPVIFTAAVTYCSGAGESASRQSRIAVYITATIIGGFSGRLIGGFMGDIFSWQAPFILFGVMSCVCAFAIWYLAEPIAFDEKPLKMKAVIKMIQQPDIRLGLCFVFITFFTFSAALNVIPFRLVELEPGISSAKISLVYIGYSVGIFIPILVRWIVDHIGGEIPTMKLGLGLLMVGLFGLFIPSANLMLLVFLILSMGMFTIHATASGLLNKLHANNASLINGAYISNYYSAAAVGSVLPVWVVYQFGWTVFVATQLCIAASAFWCVLNLNKAINNQRRTSK